ncbi:hypothetical protein B9N43_02710 [Denitratisoma sp. DHT3]|uniref:hypothetical protein n=1 Tax=Denitratisoma sp. DHT3 TaxID=1981880 RepID=UPI0011984732|nr:hypothetical protein [Denitratisoma sp. DHT3]QDX80268.1 hypothetical protein B9N43_02710 [Denitratisoma sp. DHT3]
MKKALLLTAATLLLALGLQFLMPPGAERAAGNAVPPPWRIEKLADGHTRVLGLVPGVSTLGEARQRFGADLFIAVIAAPNETGALEAYLDGMNAGSITGKLILTIDAAPEIVAAMKQRSTKSEYMESSTRKYRLAPADLEAALRLPIRAVGFIPSANLDAATVEQRFGRPVERLRASAESEHLLYPDLGLDVAVNAKGKELLQYVAPARFGLLRDKLTGPVPGAAAQ